VKCESALGLFVPWREAERAARVGLKGLEIFGWKHPLLIEN